MPNQAFRDAFTHSAEVLSASPGLESNPYKAQEIFSDKHPYFPKNCTSCPFAGSKLMALAHDLAKGKDCMHCKSVSKCIERSNRKTEKRERLRSLNAHTDRKVFRSLQKSLLKTLTKKKKLVLERKDFYTGHVFFGKNEMEKLIGRTLSVKISTTAVHHFRNNFQKSGFVDDGVEPWKRFKKQDNPKHPDHAYKTLHPRRNRLSFLNQIISSI